MAAPLWKYVFMPTGDEVNVYHVEAGNIESFRAIYMPQEFEAGDYLVVKQAGWDVVKPAEFEAKYILADKLKFRSAADARGYALELQYSIDHPDEEGFTATDIERARYLLRNALQFLENSGEHF